MYNPSSRKGSCHTISYSMMMLSIYGRLQCCQYTTRGGGQEDAWRSKSLACIDIKRKNTLFYNDNKKEVLNPRHHLSVTRAVNRLGNIPFFRTRSNIPFLLTSATFLTMVNQPPTEVSKRVHILSAMVSTLNRALLLGKE